MVREIKTQWDFFEGYADKNVGLLLLLGGEAVVSIVGCTAKAAIPVKTAPFDVEAF